MDKKQLKEAASAYSKEQLGEEQFYKNKTAANVLALHAGWGK